jgi:hypothetical protein
VGTPLCYVFFCEAFGVPLQWPVMLSLSTSVYIIYTLDHVLDGLKWKEKSLALRHFIHFKYRQIFLVLAALALIGLAFFVYLFLDKISIRFGLIVSLSVLVYFILNFIFRKLFRKLVPLKETMVAIIVASCFIALPAMQAKMNLQWPVLILFVGLVAMNLSNLLMFSYYDYEVDRKARFSGTSKVISQERLKLFIVSLIGIGLIASIYSSILLHFNLLQISVLIVMHFQLLVIALFEDIYKKNERYRFWGDIIYLYPLFYFFIS